MGSPRVGLKELHYAILSQDDGDGIAYETPVKIASAITSKITPKTNSKTLYADDGADETATAHGETDVELNMKDLDLDTQAALLGHSIVGGVLIKKADDVAPYVAIGFKSKKTNGKYRFYWMFKGKFMEHDEQFESESDNVNFQTPTIKGTFIRRINDGAWEKVTDEDQADYVASTGTNWFTDVQGAADTTAPTVTVSPAGGASGVAVGSAIVWTFNEVIQASTVNAANFFVQKADGSVQVAGSLSLDATKKIVTFTPSANLTAATQYMALVTVGVKDLAGNALAAPSVTEFTTA